MAIQTRINRRVRSGNTCAVMFGGVQIGLIQNISAQDDYSPEPASGIGDIHVAEYVPTMARHTLQVSSMMLNVGNMLAAGISMENGDEVLQGKEFDIVIASNEDGTILRQYRQCVYASGSLDVSKHTIVMQSGTFMARDVIGTGS